MDFATVFGLHLRGDSDWWRKLNLTTTDTGGANLTSATGTGSALDPRGDSDRLFGATCTGGINLSLPLAAY